MKLLDRVAETAARRHLSPLTVECYQRWIRDFLAYWARRPATPLDAAGSGAAGELDIAAGLLLDEPAAAACQRVWRHPRELGAGEVAAFLRT